jgi:hypothetical protein
MYQRGHGRTFFICFSEGEFDIQNEFLMLAAYLNGVAAAISSHQLIVKIMAFLLFELEQREKEHLRTVSSHSQHSDQEATF